MNEQIHLLVVQGALAVLLVLAQAIVAVLLLWVRRDNRRINGTLEEVHKDVNGNLHKARDDLRIALKEIQELKDHIKSIE